MVMEDGRLVDGFAASTRSYRCARTGGFVTEVGRTAARRRGDEVVAVLGPTLLTGPIHAHVQSDPPRPRKPCSVGVRTELDRSSVPSWTDGLRHVAATHDHVADSSHRRQRLFPQASPSSSMRRSGTGGGIPQGLHRGRRSSRRAPPALRGRDCELSCRQRTVPSRMADHRRREHVRCPRPDYPEQGDRFPEPDRLSRRPVR